MIYKIVQTINGRLVATCPKDIYAWAEANGRRVTGVNRNPRQRVELHEQPRLSGLVGPMFDGYEDDEPVIRYEDREAYDFLST